MKTLAKVVLFSLLVSQGLGAESYQLLWEKRHYALYWARQFEDQMWVNYKGQLYYGPCSSSARNLRDALNSALKNYKEFTNKVDRSDFLYSIVRKAKTGDEYKQWLTTPNTTYAAVPVLVPKKGLYLESFRLVQSLVNGEAIIETTDDAPETYYVYGLGRAVDGKTYGALKLIQEELKTYETALGGSRTVQSYTAANLIRADESALLSVRFAFEKCGGELWFKMDALKKSEQEKAKSKK